MAMTPYSLLKAVSLVKSYEEKYVPSNSVRSSTNYTQKYSIVTHTPNVSNNFVRPVSKSDPVSILIDGVVRIIFYNPKLPN